MAKKKVKTKTKPEVSEAPPEVEAPPEAEAPAPAIINDDIVTIRGGGPHGGGVRQMKRSEYDARQKKKGG